MAIYETNAFEAGLGSVIYPEASRINHSCLPNVHHCWNNISITLDNYKILTLESFFIN